MAKVSVESNPNQPQTQGNINDTQNRGNFIPGSNTFSLGFTMGQPTNIQNQRNNQPGNSVFIRAVATNNNPDLQNVSQNFNNFLGNIIGNPMNPNIMNSNFSNPNLMNTNFSSQNTMPTNGNQPNVSVNNNINAPAQPPNENASNVQPPLRPPTGPGANPLTHVPFLQPLNLNLFQNMSPQSTTQNTQGNQNLPQGNQNTPQGNQNVPQGNQNVPQGNMPTFIHFQPINLNPFQNIPQQPNPQRNQNVPQGTNMNQMPQSFQIPQGIPVFVNQQTSNPILNTNISPNQNILNMALILNRLMGAQSQFPGPALPRPNGPLNTLHSLGSYLSNYEFQLMRANPYLSRLADLLTRESAIDNRQDRAQIQHFAHEIGHFLEEMMLATRPMINLLKNLQLGDYGGNFRIVDFDRVGERMFDFNGQRMAATGYISNNLIDRPSNAPAQQQPQTNAPVQQPQTQPQPNVPVQQPQTQPGPQSQTNENNNNNPNPNREEISISITGIEIEEQNPNGTENTTNNNSNAINNQEQSNNSGNRNPNGVDILSFLGSNNVNLGGLINGMLGLAQVNQGNANQNQIPRNQMPPNQMPQNLNQVSQGNQMPQNQMPQNQMNLPNLQIMFGGGGGGGMMLQSVMEYSLKDLIMENYGNQLEGMDEEFLYIFGNLKVGEIVTAFLGNYFPQIKIKVKMKGRNFSFLTRHHEEIRKGLTDVLAKYNNDSTILSLLTFF